MSPVRPSAHPPARGFTLLEVLIAILIFSIAVIGVVGMQAKLLQSSTQNGDRARASMLANEIAAQMWAQQSVTLSSSVISAWQTRVSDARTAGLPNGTGTVTTSTTGTVTTAAITVAWTPTNAASGAVPSQYITSVVIP
jgi:type IV pilus assembly protein PilV